MIVPDQPAGPTGGRATQVDAALARLDELERLPLHEHPDLYQSVHADLQSALAAIDDA